jgi:hypothetical protein
MREWVTTVGELAGFALVTVGVALINMPAAFIFAGAAAVFLSVWSVKR